MQNPLQTLPVRPYLYFMLALEAQDKSNLSRPLLGLYLIYLFKQKSKTYVTFFKVIEDSAIFVATIILLTLGGGGWKRLDY